MKSLVTSKNLKKIHESYKGILWTDNNWFYITFERYTAIKARITGNPEIGNLKGPSIENKTIRLNTVSGFGNFQEFYLNHEFRYPTPKEALGIHTIIIDALKNMSEKDYIKFAKETKIPLPYGPTEKDYSIWTTIDGKELVAVNILNRTVKKVSPKEEYSRLLVTSCDETIKIKQS